MCIANAGLSINTEELVNGNPSGFTNSKDEVRKKNIEKLDLERIEYICGEYITF